MDYFHGVYNVKLHRAELILPVTGLKGIGYQCIMGGRSNTESFEQGRKCYNTTTKTYS